MDKLKAGVILIVVLSLLVVAVAPVAAGKPSPGAEKSKGAEAPGQSKPKKSEDATDKPKKNDDSVVKPKKNEESVTKPKKNQESVTKPKKNEEKKLSPSYQEPVVTPEPDELPAEMVTICHKPDTPAQQTLQIASSALGAHLKHGDSEGACEDESVLPSPVPTDTLTMTVTVTLCHKPGTPAEKTLHLPQAAVKGHLGHGDYLGSCDEVTPTPTPAPTSTMTVTVTLCHKPGTPAEKTLQLPQAAVNGHLRHGDYLGSCDEVTPTPTPAPTSTMTVTVTLCHKPGTPAEKTLQLPQAAMNGHLRHGDYLGSCDEVTPTPTPVPTDTQTVTVCHKPGTTAEQTLEVPVDDVEGHLNHGDTIGACDETPSGTWGAGVAVGLDVWLVRAFVWPGPRRVVLY